MTDIILPAGGWQPRPYQRKLWRYLEGGGKRALVFWHRRAGKDDVCLNWAGTAMVERPATYWHMLPEAAQARKAIWDAVNPHTGKKRIDEAFPPAIRQRTRNNEMYLELVNGAAWQVVGSDNFNSLVGAPPAGVVFSEWALADPAAWAFIRPILRENGGWALFITTPRGMNHAKTMFDGAKDDPSWFTEVLPATETGVFSDAALAQEEAEYIREFGSDDGQRRYRQEYLCDFDAAVVGSYYGTDVARLDKDGRIRAVEWEPRMPVHTAWDLGIGDQTAIWMFQKVGDEIRVLDFIRNSGVHLGWYVNALRERPYTWGTDLLPHDAEPKRLQTGESVQDTLRGLGRPNSVIVPMHNVYDGINAVRTLLPRCYFDSAKTADGLSALRQYRREWDDKRKVFKEHPLHDWCFTGEVKILTRSGTYAIKDLPFEGEVLTPWGWKQYRNPRVTRRNAPLVEVLFSGGYSVKCTPDHMFLTVSGWKSASDLRTGSLIQSTLTRSRSISMAASTAVGRAARILRAAASFCTGTYGLLHSALSQRGAIFTTGTAIRPTTGSLISNAYRLESTSRTLGECPRQTGPNTSQKAPVKPLLSGIGLKRGDSGTRGTPLALRAGLSGSERTGLAKRAARSLARWFGRVATVSGGAATTAKPLAIVGVWPLAETEDVWCLTVPEADCFSLSNGAVVHNCSDVADAFRYLAMGLKLIPDPNSWGKPLVYPKAGIV